MNKDVIILNLQQQIEQLTQQVQKLTSQKQQLLAQLSSMQEKLDLFLHQMYGKRSERKKNKQDVEHSKENEKIVQIKSKHNNCNINNVGRKKLPENLPRVKIKHELKNEELLCMLCGTKKHCIGKVITEQLDCIPAKFFVNQHVRYKYACKCGDCGVAIAKMPSQPIEKGLPGPGLLAHVIDNKYQDALPLYRQMLRFRRFGINISDSTLCDWIAASSELLKPLVERMKGQSLLKDVKIHTDDTTIPVLSKGKTKQGRLWVYVGSGIKKPSCIIYDYTPTRSQAGPMRFLKNYTGYMQADAYSGYDKIYATQPIIEVGCMAHARRKFTEVSIAAKGDSTDNLLWIIIKFRELFVPLSPFTILKKKLIY